MNNIECAFAAVAVIALMLGLSLFRTNWPSIRAAFLPLFSAQSPRRVSGD